MISIFYVGVDMYSPSLPEIAKYYEISTSYARWSITIFIITFTITQLIFGSIINLFSHKKMAIILTLIFLMGCVVCTLSPSIFILYLGRIIQAVGVSGLFPLGFATLKNHIEGKALDKAIPINSMVSTSLASLAPITGSYITLHFSWQSNFMMMMLIGIVLIMSLIFLYHPVNTIDKGGFNFKKTNRGYAKLTKNIPFIINSVMAANTVVALIAFYTLMPFIITTSMGGSLKLFGGLSLYFVLLGLAGRFCHLVYLNKVLSNIHLIILFSILIFIGAFLFIMHTLFYPISLYAFIFCFSLIIFGSGVVNPNCQTLVFQNISKAESGHASVLFGVIGGAYIGLAAVVAATLSDTITSLAIILIAPLATLGLIGSLVQTRFKTKS